MNQQHETFGELHANAPRELARFAFLIGRWRCEARIKSPGGEWLQYAARWLGRFILDGYAIADEYRMTDSSGALIVLGTNFRTFDAANQTWHIRWLNAFTGTWTELGSDEMGGVTFDGSSISFAFKEPLAAHAYTRATYTNISQMHFTWIGEKSANGHDWSEFMIVEADRSDV